jgi:hypothetical protein
MSIVDARAWMAICDGFERCLEICVWLSAYLMALVSGVLQQLTSELGTNAQVQSLRVPYMRRGYKGYRNLLVLYVFIRIPSIQA